MLTVDMLAVLALFVAVSGLDPLSTFHYTQYPSIFRRNAVGCQMCYGEFDCFDVDKGRCCYTAAAAAILKEDDGMKIVNDALRVKVDSMMYDLVLEDSIQEYVECIPLISSYTQCNKENICTGCYSCDCDKRGRWNCSDVQQCTSRPLQIDHEVLQTVMDSLKSGNSPSRHKRSDEPSEESSTPNIYLELANWLYVSKPVETEFGNNNGPKATTEVSNTTTTIKTLTNDDDNNLNFNEILNNDDLNNFIKSTDKDMLFDDIYENRKDSHDFLEILRKIEEGEDETKNVDKSHLNKDLLIDLEKYLKEGNFDRIAIESSNSSIDQPNSIDTIIIDGNDFDLDKQKLDINAINFALKRNVRDVTEPTTRNDTIGFKNVTNNTIYPEEELQHIVDVVTILIRNQRKEITNLNYVKKNLLTFIKKDKNKSSTNIHGVHRKHGWKVDMLNFYMNSLKRDIKDILKDINAIQKLKNLGVSSAERISNLKPLLFVLSSYYLKMNEPNKLATRRKYGLAPHHLSSLLNYTRTIIDKSAINTLPVKQTSDSDLKPQRRLLESSLIDSPTIKLIKRGLKRMLVIIDYNRSIATTLSPLSHSTRNIFNRIINKQYATNGGLVGVRDLDFNITRILISLTDLWQNAEREILNSKPADRLYTLKLIHLTLSQGIDKIKDVLILMQFGYSRRMNFIEETLGKDVFTEVTNYLTTVDSCVRNFLHNAMETNKVNREEKEMESIWHQIKNAFSKSRISLTKYFNNKLRPRSYIVNEMAKKRVEEVNKQKFLEVMKRWQETFDNNHVRDKRSPKIYAKRMKNIIPKYLRGKINPVLSTKTRGDQRRKETKTKGKKIESKVKETNVKNKDPRPIKKPVFTTKKPKGTTTKLKIKNQKHIKTLRDSKVHHAPGIKK